MSRVVRFWIRDPEGEYHPQLDTFSDGGVVSKATNKAVSAPAAEHDRTWVVGEYDDPLFTITRKAGSKLDVTVRVVP